MIGHTGEKGGERNSGISVECRHLKVVILTEKSHILYMWIRILSWQYRIN